MVILQFWFVLSARARARARSARPPRAGGPGLPHVQKRQVKQVLTRARVEIWPTSSFDFHRISFAVEGPPVSALSHMAELVASDLLIFIETCVFSKGNRDRIYFAVHDPPVFGQAHMGDLVASDMLIFIER